MLDKKIYFWNKQTDIDCTLDDKVKHRDHALIRHQDYRSLLLSSTKKSYRLNGSDTSIVFRKRCDLILSRMWEKKDAVKPFQCICGLSLSFAVQADCQIIQCFAVCGWRNGLDTSKFRTSKPLLIIKQIGLKRLVLMIRRMM